MQHVEKEIVEPVVLCNRKGNLNPAAIGYARKPLIQSNLTGHFMRKKKWNYWCVYGDELMFSATVSHLDYAAVCFVYIFEYETQRYFEKTVTIPLGTALKMPANVYETVSFRSHNMSIQFRYQANTTYIDVSIADFDDEPLDVKLQVEHPINDDSLNVVIPWNRQTFQFTAKHHTLPTSGYVKVGSQLFEFSTDDSYAVLDYGRGIWPREATWNWGMASQRIGRRRIGLNFGGQWTDGTGMTENAVFVNGKMHKISEDVHFEYDRANFMKPWTVRTKFSSRVELTFEPFFERIAATDAKVVKSEVHQLVGYYTGRVQLDNDTWLYIPQMLGCIEEHVAKW